MIFFDMAGEPVPMEFEGEAAAFFNAVRDCFCDSQSKDLKAILFNAVFAVDDEKDRLYGGMSGDREALVVLLANLLVSYAGTIAERPLKLSIADVADVALKIARGAETEAKSKGGIILSRAKGV